MQIKVVITDDHPLTMSGVEHILQPYPHIVITGQYTSGAALMEGLRLQQPDVLLLDIMLPDQSGKDLAEQISRTYPQIRILALTSLDSPHHVKGMMRRGCLGYLLKNTDQHTLITAIEQVYKGVEYIDPALKDQLLRHMLKGQKAESPDLVPVLTQREKEVLQMIVEEYTSQEIADKLFLSLRTVEGHRLSLLQKLDAKNTVGLVKIALQMRLVE